jgi:tRNA modification GTPase
LYETWRQDLLSARGELEALIDFSEDQHFDESPAQLCESISAQVRGLIALLEAHVSNAVKGELLRNGISVALLGLPNAGKSSLLNVIVGREAAIVAEEAGTTRDVVDVGVDLNGWFVRFGDTAGVRKGEQGSVGKVEEEGIRRAKARAMESDVVVVVLDLERPSTPGADAADLALRIDPDLQTFIHDLPSYPTSLLVAINKADLITSPAERSRILHSAREAFPSVPVENFHFISCKAATSTPSPAINTPPSERTLPSTTDGIQTLLIALMTHFANLTTPTLPSSTPSSPYPSEGRRERIDQSLYTASLSASHRQKSLLSSCLSSLHSFLDDLHPSPALGTGYGDEEVAEVDIVVAAEHLREAAGCLARITGRGEGSGDVEEVLGVVFERFCVGK